MRRPLKYSLAAWIACGCYLMRSASRHGKTQSSSGGGGPTLTHSKSSS